MKSITSCIFVVLLTVACGKPAATNSEAGPAADANTKPENEVLAMPLRMVAWEGYAPGTKEANALNKKGLDAYKAHRIEEAAELFEKAILADSMPVFAHYNLACMLALLSAAGGAGSEDEIYDELAIALGIDAVRPGAEKDWVLSRMKSDKDLEHVRNSERFQALVARGKPPVPGAAELFPGRWSDGAASTLTLNADRSYTFTLAPSGMTTESSEGTWSIDSATGNISLKGKKFPFHFFDPEKNESFDAYTGVIEYEPSALLIRLIGEDGNLEGETVTEMRRESTPLHEALANADAMHIAAVLCAHIMPYYRLPDKAATASPLETIIGQERPALTRLFLGKDGVWPYPMMQLPKEHRFFDEVEAFKKRTSAALLARGAASSRFNEKWYRELLANVLDFPDRASGGFGSYNTLFPLGYNGYFAAFLEGRFASTAPGTIYSVIVFDAPGNAVNLKVPLRAFIAGDETFPYSAMIENDGLILSLMKKEKQWAGAIEEHDITVSNRPLPIKQFPLTLGGKRIECTVEKSEAVPEEMEYMGDGFEVKIEDATIASIMGYDCRVVGCLPLGKEYGSPILAFISTLTRGFEGEQDSDIVLGGWSIGK